MTTEPGSAPEDALLLRKQIATARILLLIVAVATLVSAMLLLPNLTGRNVLMNILLTSAFSASYFLLALLTRKKPYTAILAGLLLLLAAVLLDVFWNPFGPFSRWQSKTLTLLLLLLGLADSRDAQRKMRGGG
jgi:CBS domain containing-hemolysin-like protein